MPGVEIIELNEHNADEVAKSLPNSGKALVAFLADWCGHCKAFKPEWEKIKNELKMNPNLASGKIITTNDQLMSQLPLRQPSGFPTISLFDGTEYIDDYSGPRSKEAVLDFIKENMNDQPKRKKMKGGKKKKRRSRKSRKSRKSRRSRKSKHLRKRKTRKNKKKSHKK